MDKIMMKYLMRLALKAFCMKIDEKLFDLSEIKENIKNNRKKDEISLWKDHLNTKYSK